MTRCPAALGRRVFFGIGSTEGYVTTRLRNRETLSVTISDGELSLPELPARSVVTLVLRR